MPLLFCQEENSMRGNENPSWLDKLFGGILLGGFVLIAVIAALFSLATWRGDGLRDHASARPVVPIPSTN